MKAKLEFDLNDSEDSRKFKIANKSESLLYALHEVGEEVFRPHRKHGYTEKNIPHPDNWSEETYEVVSTLEKMFYRILEERGIDFNDLGGW